METDDLNLEALLQRVRDGCQEATAQLFRLCDNYIRAEVRRHLHHKVRRLVDSTDLNQDVWTIFFKLNQQQRSFHKLAHLRKFLQGAARIAVRRAHKLYEAELARTVSLENESQAQVSLFCGPDVDPMLQAIADDLWEMLLRGQETVVGLVLTWRRDGIPTEEIAALLNISERRVQRFVLRGLRTLAILCPA